MSDVSEMKKYAQASIGTHDFRWTVKGNKAIPGAVDLVRESWMEDSWTWEVREFIECIPLDVLTWLAKQARVVARIKDGDAK